MANKTSFQPGRSGNPQGRPPKCRALTEILAAAGSEKCFDYKGAEVTRKKLLAQMVWQLLIAGEVSFYKENRESEFAESKTYGVKPDVWLEVVKWLFQQCDGDLSISIKESDDDAALVAEGVRAEMLGAIATLKKKLDAETFQSVLQALSDGGEEAGPEISEAANAQSEG